MTNIQKIDKQLQNLYEKLYIVVKYKNTTYKYPNIINDPNIQKQIKQLEKDKIRLQKLNNILNE
jgi:hypothetical protein